MEKINFQNATLKTQAHVIINGQTYNVVDAEYDGGSLYYIPSGNNGGNQPHNNLQPYITCYMFKRTA